MQAAGVIVSASRDGQTGLVQVDLLNHSGKVALFEVAFVGEAPLVVLVLGVDQAKSRFQRFTPAFDFVNELFFDREPFAETVRGRKFEKYIPSLHVGACVHQAATHHREEPRRHPRPPTDGSQMPACLFLACELERDGESDQRCRDNPDKQQEQVAGNRSG